jgi:hypothetical protein
MESFFFHRIEIVKIKICNKIKVVSYTYNYICNKRVYGFSINNCINYLVVRISTQSNKLQEINTTITPTQYRESI